MSGWIINTWEEERNKMDTWARESRLKEFITGFNNEYFNRKVVLMLNNSMKDQVRGLPRSQIETMSFSTSSGNNGISICFTCDYCGNIQLQGSYCSFDAEDLREMGIVAEEWRKDN